VRALIEAVYSSLHFPIVMKIVLVGPVGMWATPFALSIISTGRCLGLQLVVYSSELFSLLWGPFFCSTAPQAFFRPDRRYMGHRA
jgi:hypothetical protein